MIEDEKINEMEYYRPKNLEEFINSTTFSESIDIRVDVTRGEIFLMVLNYCMSNSVSHSGKSKKIFQNGYNTMF